MKGVVVRAAAILATFVALQACTTLTRLPAVPPTQTARAAIPAKGRALQIATTDLDSGRPVIWNIGAIAASQAPGALELFHKIMIASASIPGGV